MTRVDFYILKDVEVDALHRFACRLASKASGAGKEVYLHTNDEDHAKAMDELLWCYPDNRFIPHQILPVTGNRQKANVSIGWSEPEGLDGVLVNTASTIPIFFARFDRVAEIIVTSRKVDGRARYKHYRDRGYPLFHHELGDWEAA